HEHGYERTSPLTEDRTVAAGYGTNYVITGGGGGDLHQVSCGNLTNIALQAYHYLRVDVEGGRLTVRAIGLDGADMDRYVIQPKPLISERGVLSIGDYANSLAPGSLVSIFGTNLASAAQAASDLPLPREMAGTRVRFGSQD